MFTMAPLQIVMKELHQGVQLLKTLDERGGSIIGSSLLISNSSSIRDFDFLAMVNTST